MTAWSKRKPLITNDCAYGVVEQDNRFGVALFRIGEEPERIHHVGMRRSEDKLQAVADRLNSRIGVPLDRAVRIIKEAKKRWNRRSKGTEQPPKGYRSQIPFLKTLPPHASGNRRTIP